MRVEFPELTHWLSGVPQSFQSYFLKVIFAKDNVKSHATVSKSKETQDIFALLLSDSDIYSPSKQINHWEILDFIKNLTTRWP